MSAKKIFLGFLFIVLVSVLIINFQMFHFAKENYISQEFSKEGTNFSQDEKQSQQFYPNMRYSSKEISYRFEDCPISKKNDFERATEIISEKTILSFYEVLHDEEILVTCSEKERIEDGLFIAGEGGPKNITLSGDYHVIKKGSVHLIRKSECPNPNVAIHEILHALGFEHSENKNNIMYNISYCKQEIGQDTLEIINKIYLEEPFADLIITKANAQIVNKYLNSTLEIQNVGLIDSKESELIIKLDRTEVKKMNISSMEIGTGISISLSNVKTSLRKFENISFEIEYEDKEINKENNLLVLKMNKFEE